MKTHSPLLLTALLALTACGSAAQYSKDASAQRYQDGIYYTPESENRQAPQAPQADLAALDQETSALAARTRGSNIYLKNGVADTLFIPEHMSARIDLDRNANTTSVTIIDSPYPYTTLGIDWGWAYRPWYWDAWYGPRWGWYSPWHYSGWYHGWSYYDPWYWDSWYWGASPWYYGGWYGGWYSPWYSSG
ncbi:MAG: hypothetical protein II047_02215, partial [Bacteroidales bacterium]|nr:hypothetical protein [Bacteroidales bacterium]